MVHHSEKTMYTIYKTRPIPKKYSFLYETEFYPLYFNKLGEYIFLTFTINKKLYISIRGDRPDMEILKSSLFSKEVMRLDGHNSCNVHERALRYFELSYRDMKSQIDSFLNLYPEGTIEFCGYSSGGSVAILATVKFQYLYPCNIFHCTTFGSFKPGGHTLRYQINSLPGRIQNFVLRGDKISSLPPNDQGYVMPKIVIISRSRCFEIMNRERKYSLKDYLASMTNCRFVV